MSDVERAIQKGHTVLTGEGVALPKGGLESLVAAISSQHWFAAEPTGIAVASERHRGAVGHEVEAATASTQRGRRL
jgi:hypothetical protein